MSHSGLSEAEHISYNTPKPATPLKNFFLPVRENVTAERMSEKPRIIIGSPNCDIEALRLLDEIYLDKTFTDPFYRNRRNSTLLISSDCFSTNEHCHCLSYGVKPYSLDNADIAIAVENDDIFLRVISERGKELAAQFTPQQPVESSHRVSFIEQKHRRSKHRWPPGTKVCLITRLPGRSYRRPVMIYGLNMLQSVFPAAPAQPSVPPAAASSL